eukprot:364492-Chlamydomonas_euryale.AAC.6
MCADLTVLATHDVLKAHVLVQGGSHQVVLLAHEHAAAAARPAVVHACAVAVAVALGVATAVLVLVFVVVIVVVARGGRRDVADAGVVHLVPHLVVVVLALIVVRVRLVAGLAHVVVPLLAWAWGGEGGWVCLPGGGDVTRYGRTHKNTCISLSGWCEGAALSFDAFLPFKSYSSDSEQQSKCRGKDDRGNV